MIIQDNGRGTTTYTYREVHRLDCTGGSIAVTFDDGATTVVVDDRSGRGPVEYVEPNSAEPACWCQSEVDEAWNNGYREGYDECAELTYHVLDALHRSVAGHWGIAYHCYEQPCADLRAMARELGI